MNTDKKISRREALKRMGFAVMSGAIASFRPTLVGILRNKKE